ncbi:MAG TPA: type II toxin-antitoxin system mRNA interferase toxin, RelE/StbE family [Clostridiales bacterium]|jgi:mRNA interferase YafQ|nr:type II toxin-antitoxin system mRNA interferase toxin, RelE/StbE family [Clostridiales bacterium]HCC02355.1 type II toxin-antitoxin system mRNA interferase toxin, RelE/StbE family [Oscillospiraceae bacterium]
MLKIEYQSQFKKDYKIAKKRGLNLSLLNKVITMLANEQPLPERYRVHVLNNSKHYQNVFECHILSDWLLVYQIKSDILTLVLVRTGTHADLF